MVFKAAFKKNVRRLVKTSLTSYKSFHDRLTRDYRNTDIYLKSAMEKLPLLELNDPIAFVNNLRESIEPMSFNLRWIKRKEFNSKNVKQKRFDTLVKALKTEAPPIPFPTAIKLASIIDKYLGNYSVYEAEENYRGDVALHFMISSSLIGKGRLISNIVRITRPLKCLEVGTAYGMSALYILSALDANDDGGSLSTLEAIENTFKLARKTLTENFAEKVICKHGTTQDSLANLAVSLNEIDFFFHDATHSRQDYINDFMAVEHYLSSGAIILFDDIRWYDNRFTTGSEDSAYQGWVEVVKHKRVLEAVEIDNYIGLILLK